MFPVEFSKSTQIKGEDTIKMPPKTIRQTVT